MSQLVTGEGRMVRPSIILPASRPTIVEGRRMVASRESLSVPTVGHALSSIRYILKD